MSRETDSPSSVPQTRGGTAYPSGTEPYGTPVDGAPGEPAGRGAARPGEPKTETTLTTRIRINIPGSRPIPPVVVRKPVGEDTVSSDETTTGADAATDAGANGTVPSAADIPSQGANGTAADAGSSTTGGSSSTSGGRPTSSWFAPRKPPRGGASGGAPAGPPRQRTDTPPHGSPIGALADTGPLAAADRANGTPSGPGHTPPHGVPAATPPHGVPTATPPHGVPVAGGPSGPTTGPATGDMPLLPPGFRHPGAAPGASSPLSPQASSPTETGPQPTVPGPATAPEPPRTGGPAPDLGGPAPTGGRVSGDTLVSGIPRVPPADDDGRAAPAPGNSGAPVPPPAQVSAKRGRSKLVLVGVAAFGVLGVAYGAGLLLDHADVPNGTTVLGVEIGGTDRQTAMNKLEAVLGERADTPLVLKVEGEEKTLKPTVAGLALDTETTVRNASGRDYNPVSVIGSLLGGARHAEPVFKVDEEKLTAALKDLTAGVSNGQAQDGMVKFVNGKAVGVPGKPHKAVDVAQGADLVEGAYREQVATGDRAPVTLPVSLQQPEVDQKEIDRAIREFGEPAMSGLVTVKAGDREIPFSPTGSLPRFLSMKPVDGKLVDTYDLKVLEELYGSTFDGVLITRGNGTKTPVTPQDVAGALREALRETDPAKRVGVIELDPQ
ncbi:hypothetical protein [Streptomyces macrosporus]|uniref:Peptidoglycan binding domain-containing protein n=1 Tax=Streptomyces macrosporus TaxID=44032 RepID=A0ABP5XRL3_9ACTN